MTSIINSTKKRKTNTVRRWIICDAKEFFMESSLTTKRMEMVFPSARIFSNRLAAKKYMLETEELLKYSKGTNSLMLLQINMPKKESEI